MLTRREQKELYLHHHEKAEKGVAKSQFKLGEIYEFGRGVVGDYKLAAFWYQKAAENGHPFARLNLNWVRLKELGVNPYGGTKLFSCDFGCGGGRHCRCMMPANRNKKYDFSY